MRPGKRDVASSGAPAGVTERLGPEAVDRAAGLLADGQLVAFPTETVYGLGADARNGAAVAGIFAAKERPRFNPLIVHVGDLAEVLALVEVPPMALLLAEAHWPGPLTLVVRARAAAGLSGLVTAGLPSVGVRVPAHPLARQLLAAFGGPVAAPSANPSGRISPTTADHVLAGLDGRIAAVLDGGPCPVGLESTIVGVEGDRPVLLRPGGLSVDAIASTLGRPLSYRTDGGVMAPGQLESHYAPRARLRLNAQAPLPDEAWLGFGPDPDGVPALTRNLSERGDLTEAAAALFAALHALDAAGAEAIAVAPVPEEGLGQAINDRLRRAARR